MKYKAVERLTGAALLNSPRVEDWQHRAGHPGYLVTKDGQFQMLIKDDGSFVICTTEETIGKGFRVVLGPAWDPNELGIPQPLLDEAETLSVDSILSELSSGNKVELKLAGHLVGTASPKRKSHPPTLRSTRDRKRQPHKR